MTSQFCTLLKQYYIFVAFRYFTSAKPISIYSSEAERRIPALQLFGRRCNYSCWKIYCRKWSDQGILFSNHCLLECLFYIVVFYFHGIPACAILTFDQRAFYLYGPRKNASSLCGPIFFELTCMAPKRNFLPSMAFRPFWALDGVKSRVKWPFYPWQKINKMQSFVCLLYIWSNVTQINSHITIHNNTHNQVHKCIAIKWAYQMHKKLHKCIAINHSLTHKLFINPL